MWLQEFMLGVWPLSVESNQFVEEQVSVAQALAKLHTTSINCTKCHTLVDELALLESRFQQLGQCRPQLSKALADLQIEIAGASRQFTSSDLMATIHRDFYFDQVLLSSTQTVLVDLDLCCLGPPELDVGNYVGHLREYAIRYPAYQQTCQAAEDVFGRAYLYNAPNANWPAVEFWTNLTLARHIFLSTQLPGRSHTTNGLLNQTRLGFSGLVST